jgi:hypothetical protein
MQKNYLDGRPKSEENSSLFFLITIIIKSILGSIVTESVLFYIAANDDPLCAIVNILDAIIIEIAV